VTGANRGLDTPCRAADAGGGLEGLCRARDRSTVSDPLFTPLRLDVTSPAEIAAAAETCGDVEILINHADAMFATPVLAENAKEVLRREMEVNVFGRLAMARAFAPLLARNGGGAIVNMLSVSKLVCLPVQFDLRRDQACRPHGRARIQLKAHGTRVIAIYAGLIDPFVGQDVIETAENAFGGFLSDLLLGCLWAGRKRRAHFGGRRAVAGHAG
jgi:NAD(P)-dependent dehydrogenase (short-subunit alcohol dehydrogenase family)